MAQVTLMLLHLLCTCLLTAPAALQASTESVSTVISDRLGGSPAGVFEQPTDLSSSGCHRAVDKNGTVRFLVLDAGSTGTRAVLHEFQILKLRPFKLKHIRLRRYSRKPGLSAFRHFPDRSRDQLLALLTAASVAVPAQQRDVTCVALRATAGVRLLDARSRHRILQVVRGTLATAMEFLAPDVDAAKVLTGQEEAKFAWMSVNYMLGYSVDSWSEAGATTAPVLEMGGGSTQIAYETSDGELPALPPAPSSAVGANADRRKIRARSYLGLGIRESVLRVVGYKPASGMPGSSSQMLYNSSCIASNLTLSFVFGPVSIQLIGNSKHSDSAVVECFAQANRLLDELRVQSEPGLANRTGPLYAISGVYHLVKYVRKYGQLGANVTYNDSVCPHEPKGTCKAYGTSVGVIADSAKSLCLDPPSQGFYEPFYCINMALLTALLRRFELPDGAVVTGLGGSDALGWTLGFSLDALMRSEAAAESAAARTDSRNPWLQATLPLLLLLLLRRLSVMM